MMTTRAMETAARNDAELVTASLSGNRDAFGQIVARYQSLVCALAYSATGSLGQSEDLAQETFVAAWKQLRSLREPGKLRSWLCGIARNLIHNWLRRQGREPSHAAEALESIAESPSPEPLPADHAISREEESILWRSLERIPELYREPLVLFYREHQSVEHVAAALDLSEDAVKQRLSRGRKLLHEQVLAFVEGALGRTNPGRAFTIGVLAALPAFSISAQAATLGATAAKGGATAKAAAGLGLVGVVLSFPLIIFGNYLGYRLGLDSAETDRERAFVRIFYRRLLACILGFAVPFVLLMFWATTGVSRHPQLFTGLILGLAIAYTAAVAALSIWSRRYRRQFGAGRAAEGEAPAAASPVWEHRSKLSVLGLPLIHIRLRGGCERGPVKAWIAAGDCAIGGLFAFGGLAVAPVSLGGCAIGLLSFGGTACGALALGGFSLGVWSFGGLALGWQAFGGCAIAWNAAIGGVAIAREFALGGAAHAAQANNSAAGIALQPNLFFRCAQHAMNYLTWLNLLWVLPLLLWWRTIRRSGGQREQVGQ